MEIVCGGSSSILKLCALPSENSSSESVILFSWKPNSSSYDQRPLNVVESLISFEGNNIISAHSFLDGEGSLFFHHQLFAEDSNVTDKKEETTIHEKAVPKIKVQIRPLMSLTLKDSKTASLEKMDESRFVKSIIEIPKTNY